MQAQSFFKIRTTQFEKVSISSPEATILLVYTRDWDLWVILKACQKDGQIWLAVEKLFILSTISDACTQANQNQKFLVLVLMFRPELLRSWLLVKGDAGSREIGGVCELTLTWATRDGLYTTKFQTKPTLLLSDLEAFSILTFGGSLLSVVPSLGGPYFVWSLLLGAPTFSGPYSPGTLLSVVTTLGGLYCQWPFLLGVPTLRDPYFQGGCYFNSFFCWVYIPSYVTTSQPFSISFI